MKGFALKIGKSVGGILGMNLALKTFGFRIFCDIPTQAILQRGLETFHACSLTWGIETYLFFVPAMSICLDAQDFFN